MYTVHTNTSYPHACATVEFRSVSHQTYTRACTRLAFAIVVHVRELVLDIGDRILAISYASLTAAFRHRESEVVLECRRLS